MFVLLATLSSAKHVCVYPVTTEVKSVVSSMANAGNEEAILNDQKLNPQNYKVVQVAKDGGECYVSNDVASKSSLFRNASDDDDIPLTLGTLHKVNKALDFLDLTDINAIPKPLRSANLQSVVSENQFELVKDAVGAMDVKDLTEDLELANYFDVPEMTELYGAAIASMLFGKTTREMQVLLGVCDTEEKRQDTSKCLTEDEEREIRKENAWIADL